MVLHRSKKLAAAESKRLVAAMRTQEKRSNTESRPKFLLIDMKELRVALFLMPLFALGMAANWDYTDTTNWATDYPTCGGSRQSPINIDKDGTTARVGELTEGDYFGEKALIEHKPRAATITAEGPLTCASMDFQTFERLMGRK